MQAIELIDIVLNPIERCPANPWLINVEHILVQDVGNNDQRYMPRRQKRSVGSVIEAANFVDLRKLLENQMLVIPQSDGAVLMTQAFADALVISLIGFVRKPRQTNCRADSPFSLLVSARLIY